ncbi:hypothetical protein JAAARDRAFT_195056 [Jaapia argillacea MUCL 33604]|uniref:Ubiquitin-like domain-containing protein n=1 Tax=Jaapia argillacea MUCL 33604 TaxID=933084 RepID=A0A067PYR3_9AGAM|nr:hypothetical protein JAAARDRAFT_195056 [Jaapia argillacea MUCL 33604]
MLGVTVVTLTGKRVSLQLDPDSRVISLKRAIQNKEGIDPSQQRLVFNGTDLADDSRTIASLGIEEGSTVHLVLRLRKPVIYLYPPKPMNVQVSLRLAPSSRFTTIYPVVPIGVEDFGCDDGPKYGQHIQWDIHAQPNGILTERSSGIEVSYLYWEADGSWNNTPPSSRPISPVNESVGFDPACPTLTPEDSVMIPVDLVAAYLDKTLCVLGLHVEARTSFITFWLPYLKKHRHIILRFLPQQSYSAMAPLRITPEPDVVRRVFMLFRGEDDENVEEGRWQQSVTRGREESRFWKEVVDTEEKVMDNGENPFTVLEWGGMQVI